MEYRASQVATILKCPVEFVSRLGQVILPDDPAFGKGYRIGYSFRNILEVCIAEQLIAFGVPRKKIQFYLNGLRRAHNRWLEIDGPNGWVVLDSELRWAAGMTLEGAISMLPEANACIVIDIGKMKWRITRCIMH